MALASVQIRRKTHPKRPWLLAFLAAVVGTLCLLWPLRLPLQRVGYAVYRQTFIWRTEWHLRNDHRIASAQFLVLYPKGHATSAREILQLAEKADAGETVSLGVHPQSPLVIVLYPNQAALNQAVGLSSDQNNIGFYWHGVIAVLGPGGLNQAIGTPPSSYAVDGPVDHELGHALLNWAADGNYPAWFNEGIAQWEDYRQTGYQWLTPHNYLRSDSLYPYSALSSHFYALPHQSLAYREGFALIQYLVHIKGTQSLRSLVGTLRSGTPFALAVKNTYGFPVHTLFAHWQKSLRNPV